MSTYEKRLEGLSLSDEQLEEMLAALRLSEEELRAIADDLRCPHGGAGRR